VLEVAENLTVPALVPLSAGTSAFNMFNAPSPAPYAYTPMYTDSMAYAAPMAYSAPMYQESMVPQAPPMYQETMAYATPMAYAPGMTATYAVPGGGAGAVV